jgi:hypothetical protein
MMSRCVIANVKQISPACRNYCLTHGSDTLLARIQKLFHSNPSLRTDAFAYRVGSSRVPIVPILDLIVSQHNPFNIVTTYVSIIHFK